VRIHAGPMACVFVDEVNYNPQRARRGVTGHPLPYGHEPRLGPAASCHRSWTSSFLPLMQ